MSHQIYPNMYQSIANNIRHLIGGEIWEISLLLNSDLDKCSHYRPRGGHRVAYKNTPELHIGNFIRQSGSLCATL